jgi:hypothetical protein
MISTRMPHGIKMINVYKVRYKDNLSEREIQILKSGVDYIPLYSENCAKTLIKLILVNDLLKYIENSVIIAISSKVEKLLMDYFRQIVTCDYADQILEKLEKVLPRLCTVWLPEWIHIGMKPSNTILD